MNCQPFILFLPFWQSYSLKIYIDYAIHVLNYCLSFHLFEAYASLESALSLLIEVVSERSGLKLLLSHGCHLAPARLHQVPQERGHSQRQQLCD